MRISDWSSDVCSSDLRMTGVATTEKTRAATLIQTRHRVPETPLHEDQILVYQVPIPEPLRWLEPRETETRKMHGLSEYGVMHVKLSEDISHHVYIPTASDYPLMVNGIYLIRSDASRVGKVCAGTCRCGGSPGH